MEGIIVSKRRLPEAFEYLIFDGKNIHRIISTTNIRGREVIVDGNELKEGNTWEAVKNRFMRNTSPSLPLSKELEPFKEKLESVWKQIAFLKVTQARTLIYHDADADGLIAALMLSEHLNAQLRPVNPWNLETLSNLNPDLDVDTYILLDLGSSASHRPAIDFLSSLKPTIVIDHHEVSDHPSVLSLPNEFFTSYIVSLLLSTWNTREDWLRVAAAGERSSLIEWKQEDREKALALELSLDIFRYNPSIFKRILETDLWKPLWEEVKRRFEYIDSTAEKEEIETPHGKLLILHYDVPFHYPHRGKVASWYHEKGYHTVIVIGERTVSVRSELPLLPHIRSKFTAFGHPHAFTIHSSNKDEVIRGVMDALENAGNKNA